MAYKIAVSVEDVTQRVAQAITRYNMLSSGDRLGVAVSGGADSVVLLHLLYHLSKQLKLTLIVLHVNHGLRGLESEADEVFVRNLAKGYNLLISVHHGSVKAGNLEQEARRTRREFFRQARQEQNLFKIALGHTQTDQAETMLFRLLRGSGMTGLAGMSPVSKDGLIRPLLSVSREQVRQFAEQNSIAWREDSSNQNLRFARNRLRLETIPQLVRNYNSNLEGVLAGTAEIVREEESYWQYKAGQTFDKVSQKINVGTIIKLKLFNQLPLALRRRVTRHAVSEVRGHLQAISFAHINSILAVSQSSHGHDRVLVPGLDIVRSFDSLLLCRPEMMKQPRDYCVDLQPGVVYSLPFAAGELKITRIYSGSQNCDNFKDEQDFWLEKACVNDHALTAEKWQVRNWEPGDRLLRIGHATAEKVKTLFQDQKVLLWERRHWPVIVAGKEIVWVRRFGVAANFSVSDASRCQINIFYRPYAKHNKVNCK